jgi:hypothetical protein
VRVYHLKLNELLHYIRSRIIFGPCIACMPLSWAIFFLCVFVLHLYYISTCLNYTSISSLKIVLHTIEFQKRGLPHAHIIFWVSTDTFEPTSKLIDSLITTEIPDPETDPLGYILVSEHMIHGLCGEHNPTAPCMKNGRCSKNYPKPFQEETTFDNNGFVVYRRRNNGRFVTKGGVRFDNRFVMPTNLALLKKLGHI